jgi:hypothetical protein
MLAGRRLLLSACFVAWTIIAISVTTAVAIFSNLEFQTVVTSLFALGMLCCAFSALRHRKLDCMFMFRYVPLLARPQLLLCPGAQTQTTSNSRLRVIPVV